MLAESDGAPDGEAFADVDPASEAEGDDEALVLAVVLLVLDEVAVGEAEAVALPVLEAVAVTEAVGVADEVALDVPVDEDDAEVVALWVRAGRGKGIEGERE
jgi:hypothetical protein